MNSNSIPLNQFLPVCPISVNGDSTLIVGQAKKTLVLFWFLCLSPILHPICQQIMLGLPSKYIQNLIISHHLGPKQPSYIWTSAMTSQRSCLLILLWALLCSVIFSDNVTPSLLRNFQWLPVQSLPSSSVASPISFLTTLPLTHTLGTLPLLFLKCSRDLSTWGPLCLLCPLPYCPMVSPGLVLTLSLDIKSHFLSETFLFAFLSTISNLLCVFIFLP